MQKCFTCCLPAESIVWQTHLCKLASLHGRRRWGWATACGMSCVVVFRESENVRDFFAQSLTSVCRNWIDFTYIHVPKFVNYCSIDLVNCETSWKIPTLQSVLKTKDQNGPNTQWFLWALVSNSLRTLLEIGCPPSPNSPMLSDSVGDTELISLAWWGAGVFVSRWVVHYWGHVPGSVSSDEEFSKDRVMKRLGIFGGLIGIHWL